MINSSITDFHEEQYRFLSNFYEAHVLYGGLVYGSNEAAFQAQKKALIIGMNGGKKI